MSAQRPSDLLKNKTNVHPVINRSTQATAEDFVEAGEILDNHADILNALLNTSGADFYGIFATLAALQAAYPIGGVINEGSYAIITLGAGNPIEIAVYTTADGWQIVDQTSQVLLYTNRNAFPATGQEGIWYIDKAATRSYLWYNATYNLMGSNATLPATPFKKNFLPLSGVELNQDLLSIIADAILLHAPWTCAAGQKMEFFTANVATDAAGSVFEIRHYVLNRFITEIGAGADISLTGDDIIPLGKITNEVPDEENSSLVAALGNIGSTDLEDAFNEGKLIGAGPARGPWEVGTIFFVTATQTIEGDDVLKRFIFRGDPGLYGGDDLGTDPDILEATAQMFQDITEEPQLPTSENNIIAIKPVLDTDLSTIDPEGLADYFNALDPGIMKQGYESWRIVVVDDEDAIVRTFDLVDRGKGPVGLEAIADNPANTLTADMFFEINSVEIYNPYGTIALMLADQANQTDQQIIKVTDASADANITFAVGETRLQAYYTYLGTTTGTMADYELISAPYGNHTAQNEYTEGENILIEDNAISVDIPDFEPTSTIFGTIGNSSVRGDMVFDTDGNLYITNYNDNNVTKITPSGVSSIFATVGSSPVGIDIDASGNLYVANFSSDSLSKITPAGVSTIFVASIGNAPTGVKVGSDGNIYVANQYDSNVVKVTPAGVKTILASNVGFGPSYLAEDSFGNIWVTNALSSGSVTKITPAGFKTNFNVSNPERIAIDGNDNVYITIGNSSNYITKIDSAGVITSDFAVGGNNLQGIKTDADGNIYVVSRTDDTVQKITPSGVVSLYGTTGADPSAIQIDDDGNVYTLNVTSDNVTKIGLDTTDRILAVNENKEIVRTYIPNYQAGTNVNIDFTDPRYPIINGIGQSTHTGTVIPLDKINGSANNTATWNATYTLGTLVAGGNAINIIDTTGQTVFPAITGATLLTGSAFEADKIYEMHTYTTDGTNAFYYFLIRE